MNKCIFRRDFLIPVSKRQKGPFFYALNGDLRQVKLDHNNSLISKNSFSFLERFIMQAFILLNVESGEEDKVLKELKKMDFTRESYVSYGIYDLISKIEADTMEHIKENVSKIRSFDNVRSTLTLVMI